MRGSSLLRSTPSSLRGRRPSRAQTGWLVAVVVIALVVNLTLLLRRPPPQIAEEPVTRAASGIRDAPTSPPRYDGLPPGTDAGPGYTEPGVHLRAVVDANGDFDVQERLYLERAIRAVTLRPPMLSGSQVARAQLVDLQIATDRGLVAGPPGPVTSAWSTSLPEGTTRLDLRYRIVGAAVRSSPAPPGRALIRLVPLTFASLPDVPVSFEVGGATVRNVVCRRVPPADQLCGRQVEGVWETTELPSALAVAEVQVDLDDLG